jgi:hypothetical protein
MTRNPSAIIQAVRITPQPTSSIPENPTNIIRSGACKTATENLTGMARYKAHAAANSIISGTARKNQKQGPRGVGFMRADHRRTFNKDQANQIPVPVSNARV